MVEQGFYEIEEERMGAEGIYSNGKKKERVYTRVNGYYMIGIWDNTYEQ